MAGNRASLDWYLRGNVELSARGAREQLSLQRQETGGGAEVLQPVVERQMQV